MLTYSLHRRTAPWKASRSIASQPRPRRPPPASASGLRAEHRTTGSRRDGGGPARRRTVRRRRAPARNRPPLGFGSSCRADAGRGARGAVDTDAMDEGGEAEADAMAPRWVAEEEQELVLACVRLLLPAEARALRLESCLASSVLVWIRTRPGVIRLAGSRRTSVRDERP